MYLFFFCFASIFIFFFFFFQAEDGIRDTSATGVQTCALPISRPPAIGREMQDGQRSRAHWICRRSGCAGLRRSTVGESTRALIAASARDAAVPRSAAAPADRKSVV